MAVSILIISVILGGCILLADTWLHLTTTTVLLQETVLKNDVTYNFSRILAPRCQGDLSMKCTVLPADPVHQGGAILNASKAYQTMFNVSKDNSIFSTTVGGQIYSFYAPAEVPRNLTYRASSIGINTQCSAVTRACNLTMQTLSMSADPMSAYTALPFNCNSVLKGDLAGSTDGGIAVPNATFYTPRDDTGFFLMYFADSGLTLPHDLGNDLWNLGNGFVSSKTSSTYNTEFKPTYFAIGATVAASSTIMADHNVVDYTASQTAAFLLACSSQFLRLTYSFSSEDATITDLEISPATDDAIMAITNPLLFYDLTPQTSMILGLRQAAFESSLDGLMADFARTYSRTVLSMGVGAVTPSPNLREMTQSTRQVTRMPKAPFFTLIGLNCTYAFLGMVLTALAFGSGPRRVKPVQARLTTTGLMAALLEGRRADQQVTNMRQLFQEFEPGSTNGPGNSPPKAAMEATAESGWRFRKIKPLATHL